MHDGANSEEDGAAIPPSSRKRDLGFLLVIVLVILAVVVVDDLLVPGLVGIVGFAAYGFFAVLLFLGSPESPAIRSSSDTGWAWLRRVVGWSILGSAISAAVVSLLLSWISADWVSRMPSAPVAFYATMAGGLITLLAVLWSERGHFHDPSIEDTMTALESFSRREGHLRIPQGHVENGVRIDLALQHYRNLLYGGRRVSLVLVHKDISRRLEALPGWHDLPAG